MIKLLTAGESHGDSLTGIIEGLPANLYMDMNFINSELKRRQIGYGRSHRMVLEDDQALILSGVSKGLTTGNPISISIKNRGRNIDLVEVNKPRPGHGDLVGALKYNQPGGRNILERASARETAMRVGLGSICKLFLRELDIFIYSHVMNIGGIDSQIHYYKGLDVEDLNRADQSEIRVIDRVTEELMIEKIRETGQVGDSLGGRIELIVKGLPAGIGSHMAWDRKLDGLLAGGILSIQGIKSVSFGLGDESAHRLGSEFHDEIVYDKGYRRRTNNAGGIEAGISNGEDLVIRTSMKAIPTLKRPLETVDMETKTRAVAQFERSDICAVASASIVAENVIAHILTNEILRKFGGDFMEEVHLNYKNYLDYLKGR